MSENQISRRDYVSFEKHGRKMIHSRSVRSLFAQFKRILNKFRFALSVSATVRCTNGMKRIKKSLS